MEIFYVPPDYYEERPKPCMNGWGGRYLTVNPGGEVLPCPTASSIAGLQFENVREHSLQWIWSESEALTASAAPSGCRSHAARARSARLISAAAAARRHF